MMLALYCCNWHVYCFNIAINVYKVNMDIGVNDFVHLKEYNEDY